jgi:hypothetical protein
LAVSSSIGPAVKNFIAIATAAIPASVTGEGATQVVFGDISRYVAPVTLQIIEVTGDADVAELGVNFRREETYSIVCEVVTYAGDQDYTQRFQDCMLIYNSVQVAVANNPWLSTSGLNDDTAAVRFSELGNYSIIPHATPKGQSVCSLQFHVRCSQRVDSLD